MMPGFGFPRRTIRREVAHTKQGTAKRARKPFGQMAGKSDPMRRHHYGTVQGKGRRTNVHPFSPDPNNRHYCKRCGQVQGHARHAGSGHDRASLSSHRGGSIDARCRSTYPGAKFDNGKAVRCGEPRGHAGKHFNSFAMRSW